MSGLSEEQRKQIERNKLMAKSKRMAKEIEEKKLLAKNKRLTKEIELNRQAAMIKRRNKFESAPPNFKELEYKAPESKEPESKRVKFENFTNLTIKSREDIKPVMRTISTMQNNPQVHSSNPKMSQSCDQNHNLKLQTVPKNLLNMHQVPESKPKVLVPDIEIATKTETSLSIELISPENLQVSVSKSERTTISILRNCEYTTYDNVASNYQFFRYNLAYKNLESFIKYIYSKSIKDLLNVLLPLQRSSLQPLLRYEIVKHELDRQEAALETFANYAQIRTCLDYEISSALHEHQKTALERVLASNGRLLIGDDMGLGKTLVAIATAQYYHKRLKTKILIIAPKSMIHTWKTEIEKWSPETFRPSTIQILQKSDQEINKKAQITIITYDMFARIGSNRSDFRSWAFQCLMVLDESHAAKNAKSNKTKAVNEYSTNVAKFILLLSGTPALNKPIELYSQISMVRPDVFPGIITQKKFSVRYCDETTRYLPNGRKIIVNNGCSNVNELKTYLDVFVMIRREKSECFTDDDVLPSKTRFIKKLNTEIRMNDVQLIEDQNDRCLKASGSKAFIRAVMAFYQKSAEIKLPVVSKYVLAKIKRHKDNNKFEKIVVFAHHRSMLDGLCNCLEKEGISYIRIDGDTSLDTRGEYIQDFQSEGVDSPRVAIISIIAGNAGITLTRANLVIFAELNWTPGYMAQAEDRVHRIGQTKPVTIEILICSQTVDDHIWRLLKEKHETLVRIGMGKSNAMEIASVDDILNASCLSDDSLQYNSLQFENEDDDYNELVDFQFSQADDGVSGLEMEKLSTQELIVSGNRHQSEATE